MLKEFAEHLPINLNLSAEDFQNTLTRDFVILIHENCKIDLTKSADSLTSEEMEKIVVTTKKVYEKILSNSFLPEDQKIFLLNSLLSRLFELWKISSAPELFFIKIRNNFSPAQIVSAFSVYMNNIENFRLVTDFFNLHKNIFPTKKKKIRTIGIYYKRFYNGGVERILSFLIPIYLKLGYRVIFFTDEYKPELEYTIPPPPPHTLTKII